MRAQAPSSEGAALDIAVAMVASAGLGDFVLNTIGSMLACGVRPAQIFLFHSDSAADEYTSIAHDIPPSNILPIHGILGPVGTDLNRSYSDWGTVEFKTFTIVKWFAIRWMLARGASQVVFSDIDIAWIRSPLDYLRWIAKSYDLAIQNEGIALGKAVACTGFMSLKNTPGIDEMLSELIDRQAASIEAGENLDDQDILNAYLDAHGKAYKRTWLLPEAQFPNGLFAPMFSAPEKLQAWPLSLIRPMIFHANWCVGLQAKRERLERAGLWRPNGWPLPGHADESYRAG
ncbi:MAG TPA: putative nucleotide-diphospho-sugar transferase [Caulobacteraceae bacterium]